MYIDSKQRQMNAAKKDIREVDFNFSNKNQPWGLAYCLSFTILSAFLGGPVLSVGGIDLILFDIAFILLLVVFTAHITREHKIIIPAIDKLSSITFAYFALAIGLPILGLFIYDYPMGYIVGDLRWFQVMLVGLAIIYYSSFESVSIINMLLHAFKILVVFNMVFVIFQSLHYYGAYTDHWIISIWYITSPNGIESSYHLGRYAGAAQTITVLGHISALGIILFGYTFVVRRDNLLFLTGSTILLIASNVRTSAVAIGAWLFISLLLSFKSQGIEKIYNMLKRIRQKIVFAFITTPILGYILYRYDVGRIRTESSRFTEIFGLITGSSSWEQVSGRGGSRWGEPIELASTEYTFGTLANPAWVFSDLPVIDSYIVITYLQGGILYSIIFLITIFLLGFYSIKLYQYDSRYIIVVGFVAIVLFHSITQNFITGIFGKVILVTGISTYYSMYKHQP